MKALVLMAFAAMSILAQTQVSYPDQVKKGPLYVYPSLSGLPTVCSASTPLAVVVNTIYQNQAVVPACNWVSTGGSIVGAVNKVAKFTSATNIGTSGITDDGTTVSTTEGVDFSGAAQTLPAAVYPTLGSFPSTGCKPGQLAINLSAGLGQQVYANSATGTCSWTQQAGVGSTTIAVTTNVIVGDGAGNGADSGIAPVTLIVSTGFYSNPGWLTAIADTKIQFSDNTTGNASTSGHGFLPKLSGTVSECLSGTGTWVSCGGGGGGGTIPNTTNLLKGDGAGNAADSGIGASNVIVSSGSYTNPSWLLAIADSKVTFANITTGNTNSSTHGYAPKLPADATKYLDGTGTWTVPAGSASGTVTSVDLTIPTWLSVSGNPITTAGTLAIIAATGQTAHKVIGTCGTATSFAPCSLVAGDLPLIPESGLSITNVTTGNATASAHGFLPILPADATKFLNGTGAYTVPPGQSGGVITYSTNSSTYTTSATDSGKMIVFTGLSQTLQLVNVGASPTWWVMIKSASTSSAQLNIAAPAGGGIDGGNSNIFIPSGQGVVLYASGATAFYSQPGLAPTGVYAMAASSTTTLVAGNAGQLVSAGCASACTINMPSSFPVTPFSIFIQSTGAGTVSVSGNGTNIDGSASSISLTTGQGIYIASNGSVWYSFRGLGGSGSGTVTSVSQTVPTWLSVSGSPVTGSGTLAITSATGLSSHQVIGTCGTATTVSLCSLVAGDLPAITSGSAVQKASGGGLAAALASDIVALFSTCSGSQYLGADGACHNAGGGAGTVTSVALAMPSWLSVSGSPVTTSGTLTAAAATGQTPHQVIGTCGTATSFTPCALVAADLPAITTGSAIQKASSGALTAATAADVVALFSTCSGIQYLGADGACHATGGTGTVTSVGLSVPAWLTATGSPVTTSGTLAITGTSQTQNLVLASPNGSSGAVTPRALVAADLPTAIRARSIGVSWGVKGGSPLATGEVIYLSAPFGCTISAWNLMIDTGTITIDVWKIASGTAVPTVTNTITASALPAISSGTALHSTTLTGWTTSVTANDIFGFNINAISGPTTATFQMECDQ